MRIGYDSGIAYEQVVCRGDMCFRECLRPIRLYGKCLDLYRICRCRFGLWFRFRVGSRFRRRNRFGNDRIFGASRGKEKKGEW